ncbi:MAG: hypothetical protein GY732_10640 [Gammaproteobacteria bacterium]|nr:hypothetical protein [Gammaproteobacteria bacterium]
MKRRQFLSSTMATATLAAMPGLVSAKADKTDVEILRLGFIGTGRQGQKHIRFNFGQPGFELRTLCDILPFHLDKAMGMVGPKQNR